MGFLTFCLASNLFLFFVSLQVMFNHDTISHYLATLCWFCYLVAFFFVCFYCFVSFEDWSGDRTVSLLSFFILMFEVSRLFKMRPVPWAQLSSAGWGLLSHSASLQHLSGHPGWLPSSFLLPFTPHSWNAGTHCRLFVKPIRGENVGLQISEVTCFSCTGHFSYP